MIAGRYTLDREIGRGGMGAVWLGRDDVLGREVALKRIGFMPDGGRPDLERAEREARLAARLNHPHVVAVYDLVVADDQQWLVMEYIAGMTLAQLVQRDGPLSPDAVAPLLWQAADALAAAHGAGIVHRDVKPSNILVTPDGQVKLSDFGIARAEADASLTQTGLVTGSPAYLAPEVASGATATDASDVWSLGATLFHALAGAPPYDVGDNLMGALYRIVHEDPPRTTAAGRLAPLLERTMTRDPAERWSMAEVRDFLAPGATSPGPVDTVESPIQVPVPEDGTRVLAPVRRRPSPTTLVLVAGAVVAAVLIGVALLTGGNGRDAATDAAPPAGSTSAEPSESGTTGAADRPTVEGITSFITTYLATAPSDPEAGFAMLTPAFQRASNGIDGYSGFWDSISSAEPLSVSARPGDLAVDYTVRYTREDGQRVQDAVTLQLTLVDGTYLIAGESG